jgi:para-aminobenzoate synthetase component 1
MSQVDYKELFDKVMSEIQAGNSYLTNLTVSTPVFCNLDLLQLFKYSSAKYKLWVRDAFTVFSPECFVRIKNNEIYTYPMKGTLPDNMPDSENKLRSDSKEDAEHYTIIDLLRNDLNMVAEHVQVSKFKQIDKIPTHKGPLLQMSSEVKGRLKDRYRNRFGDLLDLLLPAGSITGAPKTRTVEIIQNIENHKRGFYTGVFGMGCGNELESAVMIRFIEKSGDQYYFKSGGGITSDSDYVTEFQEFINKVYVPIF